jgi:hypothetical protein
VAELRHLANAWILFRLLVLNQEYVSDPRKIPQEFNQFIHRKEVLPADLGWAYRRNLDLDSTFVIEIPRFEPLDLFYLIVRPSDSSPRPGFLFRAIDSGTNDDNAFLMDLIRATTGTYGTFSDVVDQIAQAALKNYSREYATHPVTMDFEKEIRRRKNARPTFIESKVYSILLTLYAIIPGLKPDARPPFNTEDLFIVESN